MKNSQLARTPHALVARPDLRKAMGRDVPLTTRIGYAFRYNLAKVFTVQRAACHPVLRRLAPEYEGACDNPMKVVLGTRSSTKRGA